MGALYGVGALPDEWVEQVVRLNPEPDLTQVAEDMCDVVSERAGGQQRRCADVLSLLRREDAVAPQTERQ